MCLAEVKGGELERKGRSINLECALQGHCPHFLQLFIKGQIMVQEWEQGSYSFDIVFKENFINFILFNQGIVTTILDNSI